MGLHLLKSPKLDTPVARFQGNGNKMVGKWILSFEEIQAYGRIVTAIQKTIEKQKLIDKIYKETEFSLN
ncbi:MAG TPA: hypothetical protein VJZ49_00505 [Syntrophales bacterium]|nr:hypothetical protein [Syntrophales bacterium]